MGTLYNERQLKTIVQLAILYDVQNSVKRVSDGPTPTITKRIGEWLKDEYPEMHKKFGLDEIVSFGKMKSPTWHPEAYKKIGMDAIPLTADGRFSSPSAYPDAYHHLGLGGIRTDAVGKIAPYYLQTELLVRNGLDGSTGSPPLSKINYAFGAPNLDMGAVSLEEKFRAHTTNTVSPSAAKAIRDQFLAPSPQ